ncbi:alpha-N-arabinofuranosidase [Amycolatopsis sp.]|uniref:arabinosylfuranosidase ArfA n=1 Tax=Amycolatopsis sp. TaxID=37632 RepID=UPI002D7E4629|nr:alpha-N-arabinofuranosidase [Amycolatopsis sp.]HET6706260.1 alpha-N-arabinofuranosidase [Amycolatopsis sp.]
MSQARLVVDPAFVVGETDPRLYGSFVEHLGRCVHTGIHEPGHPTADEHGFRGDVAELVTELGVPILRYPGGNFVSGYRWEDGVGPREHRPTRLDLAWRSVESNVVGTDEFCGWARRVGAEPMLAVNLGTRGVAAAANLVEYCNHPGGTYWSDLRRSHGVAEPHAVRVWCLGNEMDGPWQLGHKTAEEYARLAARAAQAMRLVDPGIELVACGSSGGGMPTFPEWDATVLEHCYEQVDHLSLHSYSQERDGDRASFLACATGMDAYLDTAIATADYVRAKGRHKKRLGFAFDEWNVWHSPDPAGERAVSGQAPRLLEERYTVADAVVVGSMLISLLRHADRVRIACLAQLVNAIGAIRTEPAGPAWRQTIFHPFALTSRYGRGEVLRPAIAVPTYETAEFGEVPLLDAVAVRDDEGVVVFAVNRDQHAALPLTVELRAIPHLTRATHTYVGGDDPLAANTEEEPHRVVPRTAESRPLDGGELAITLPPLSWNLIRVT